ncbi:hypothetical protein CG419_01345 [Latilactobacillus curvatus]|uniref:DUF2971 domain-containing protein n=1 Tax=Latilactobacillus curvatus TaxID=28038 RepID=A0AAC9UN79_LATCU|nr:DUF2971 domain-containing protein [Latilactobacillus curvatus]ASN59350.1 hypothetical protein CG419_01345 [Latilactobacillus curvatus]
MSITFNEVSKATEGSERDSKLKILDEQLKKNPDDEELIFTKAYFEKNDSVAIKLYEKLVNGNYRKPSVLNNLGVLYEECDISDGIVQYTESLELEYSETVWSNLLKTENVNSDALSKIINQHYDDNEENILKVIRDNVDQVGLKMLVKIKEYFEKNESDKDRMQEINLNLDRLIILLDPDNPEILFEIGYNSSDSEEVIDVYEKYLKIYPNNAAALNNIGVEKNGIDALVYYSKALEIQYKDLYFENLKRALNRIEKSDLVEKELLDICSEIINRKSKKQIYNKVLEFNSDNLEALRGLVATETSRELKLTYLERLLDLGVMEFDVYFNIGIFSEDEEEKYKSLKKAAEMRPHNVQVYYELAKITEVDKQIKYYKKILSINDYEIEATEKLANLVTDKEEKKIYYRKAMKLNPRNAINFNNYGVLLKTVESRRKYFELAYKKDNGENAVVMTNLAQVVPLEKRWKLLEEAVSLEEDIPGVTFDMLGSIYVNNKEFDKALVIYSKQIEMYPDAVNKIDQKVATLFLSEYRLMNNSAKYRVWCEKILKKVESKTFYELSVKEALDFSAQSYNETQSDELYSDLIFLYLESWEFMESRVVKEDIPLLAHYTSKDSFDKIKLKDSKFRISNTEYMNDPQEGNMLIDFILEKGRTELLENITGNFMGSINSLRPSSTFVASLTKEIDSLPLWSMYGEDGKGVCCVINKDSFRNGEEHLFSKLKENNVEDGLNFLYEVVYIDENGKTSDRKTSEFLENIVKILKRIDINLNDNGSEQLCRKVADFISEILERVRFLFKNVTYSYEKEYRILKFMDIGDQSNNKLIHCENNYVYIELDGIKYSKAILGSKVAHPRMELPSIFYEEKFEEVRVSNIKYQ